MFKTANGLNLGYFAILGQDKYASGPKLCILVCSKLLERVFLNKPFDVYVVCRFWRRAKICIQRNKAMISNFSPGFYIFQTLWHWAKRWDPTDDPWLGQPVGSVEFQLRFLGEFRIFKIYLQCRELVLQVASGDRLNTVEWQIWISKLNFKSRLTIENISTVDEWDYLQIKPWLACSEVYQIKFLFWESDPNKY